MTAISRTPTPTKQNPPSFSQAPEAKFKLSRSEACEIASWTIAVVVSTVAALYFQNSGSPR